MLASFSLHQLIRICRHVFFLMQNLHSAQYSVCTAKDLKKKISRDCLVIYRVNSSSNTAKSTAAISLGQDGRIHCVIRNTLRIARNPPPCQSVAPKWRTRPRRLTSKTRCLQTARSWVRQATRPTPVRASQSLSRGRDACCPCPPRRTVSHARTYHVRGCKAC